MWRALSRILRRLTIGHKAAGDWQLDIDDDGGQTGRCPICHSHYVNFSGYSSIRGECFDCGFTHEGIVS
jgi:uncharacterized protein (DUF983 family)